MYNYQTKFTDETTVKNWSLQKQKQESTHNNYNTLFQGDHVSSFTYVNRVNSNISIIPSIVAVNQNLATKR